MGNIVPCTSPPAGTTPHDASSSPITAMTMVMQDPAVVTVAAPRQDYHKQQQQQQQQDPNKDNYPVDMKCMKSNLMEMPYAASAAARGSTPSSSGVNNTARLGEATLCTAEYEDT